MSEYLKTLGKRVDHSHSSPRSPPTHQQSVTKIIGKTAIWAISCFYPLPPLSNVEKQRAKLASSYVMDSQHCIG